MIQLTDEVAEAVDAGRPVVALESTIISHGMPYPQNVAMATEVEGIVQDLNRLSYNSFISHLRKVNLPMDASAKVSGPRHLHGSQWGVIDPADSPDGGNIGLQKHLAISAHITQPCSAQPMIRWLRELAHMELLEECSPHYLHQLTKVFVNGAWVGALGNPREVMRLFLL